MGVETLDVDAPDQIAALRQRLSGFRLDVLFVNRPGTTTHDQHVRVGDVSAEEFMRVMVTNALAPMRVIEALQDLVPATGLIGAMSSGQGSITNNETGMREVYRASKAALNMFMRSFAARQAEPRRAMMLMAPGWIRTDLGGPDAPFSLEESVPALVDVMLSERARPGLEFLERQVVPYPGDRAEITSGGPAGQAAACALRRAISVSRAGGMPKKRPYSRVNCGTLS